ncbi:MAG: S8 family serine peptidase [Acidobacteriota bacterium]
MKQFSSFLAALLVAASAVAEEPSIDPRVFGAAPEGQRASFLVVLREQADLSGAAAIQDPIEKRRFVFEALREEADRSQAPLAARLRAAGATFRSHYLVNMLEVEGDRALALEMARRPEVTRIAANRPSPLRRVPQAEPAEPLSAGEQAPLGEVAVGPNLERIRAPEVWAEGFTGQGIVVGDADTGFAWEHPALKPHYRGFDGLNVTHDYNWHDAVHDAAPGNPCGSNSAAPCDDSGHGTGTAGIAVGGDGAGNQIGVAPGASLIGCRNMDQGNGTPARYTECFEFFLAPTDSAGRFPRPDLGADVINNSWGCPASEGCTDPEILRAVVENVRAAGIFVVVSAGNAGSQCDTVLDAPAIYEASFSIGATNNSDGIASFSSRGPVTQDGSDRLKPDLVAPGVGVRTAARPSGFTSNFSGTSASAPHVAGAVALLWSAAPALRGDVAGSDQILRLSATPLASTQDCPPYPGARVPNAVFGYGRLDVAAAVALAGPVPPRRLIQTPRERPGRTRVIPPRTP